MQSAMARESTMIDARLAEALKEYERRTPKSAAIWNHAKVWTPLGVHSNYRSLDPYPFYVRRRPGLALGRRRDRVSRLQHGVRGARERPRPPEDRGGAQPAARAGQSVRLRVGEDPGGRGADLPEVRDGPGPVQLDRPRGEPPRDADRPRRDRAPVRREVRGRLPRLPRHAPRRREAPYAGGGAGRPSPLLPADPGSSPRSPSGPASPRSTTSSRRPPSAASTPTTSRRSSSSRSR